MKNYCIVILLLLITSCKDYETMRDFVESEEVFERWEKETLNSTISCCNDSMKNEKLREVITVILKGYRDRNRDTLRVFLLDYFISNKTIKEIAIEEEFSPHSGWSYRACIVSEENPKCLSRYVSEDEPKYRKFEFPYKQKWKKEVEEDSCSMTISDFDYSIEETQFVVRSWFRADNNKVEIEVLTHLAKSL